MLLGGTDAQQANGQCCSSCSAQEPISLLAIPAIPYSPWPSFPLTLIHFHPPLSELATEVREMEAAATPPEPPGAHESRMQQMSAEAHAAAHNVQSMKNEGYRLQAEREGLKSQARDLQVRGLDRPGACTRCVV